MELEDLITIRTPEGTELRLAVAGLGSRFIAGVADLIVQGVLIVMLAALTGGVSGSLAAIFFVGLFTIWILYPIFFEVLRAGRTPGKRWTHLRVVRDDGSPVDLAASSIRNLVRLLDGPLLLYLPAIVGIAVTSRHQRPGDIAAGTLVIRDAPDVAPARPARAEAAADVDADAGAARWDVSAITVDELALVRRFLDRRDSLERTARERLAARLSEGLRPKVAGAPDGLAAERFLEQLASLKAGRG